MAKDLHNLIQVHEFEVDEKRRKLGELFRLMANLEAQAKALEEELVREQQSARANPEEAGHLYGAYAETVIDRRERLRQSMIQMESAIEESREDLRVSFMELKKYEIAQENRDRKAAKELSRRERMDLDEIGLQGHRKKKLAG
jgi:flagellar protein FliJ